MAVLSRLARPRVLPFLLYGLSLVLLLIASRLTGPSFEELGRLANVDATGAVVKGIAGSGLGALSDARAQTVYRGFDARGTGFILLAAWSKLSLGRVGIVDPLTASRLPWLLLLAAAPLSLWSLLARRFGPLLAGFGALLLLLTPRWLHAAATASDAALLGTTWLGAFALAFRARQSRQHRPRWALLAGLWVGVGATRSLAALWLVPLMIAVEVLASPRRCFRGGRLLAPSSALFALGFAPLLLLISNPGLWKSNVVGLARWALAPLAPTVQPTLVLGATIQRPPVPGGYAALWLVETTPWVLLLLALVGLGSSVVRVVRRRAEPWDVLLLAGFAATLLGPALTPLPLTLFPPRVELALPFVALAAAAGASAALSVAQPKLARPSLGVVLLAVALSSLVRVPVLGSYFSPLLGGAGRVIAARSLPPGDGSELSRMAAAMDAMGLPQITISAEPEVPPNAFSTLRELGRMRAAVVIVPRGRPAQLQLTRGAVPDAVARVEAGGAVLWSLAPSP